MTGCLSELLIMKSTPAGLATLVTVLLVLLFVCSKSSLGLKSENIRSDSLPFKESTDRQSIKDIVIENQWQSYSTHWFYCDNQKETKGVALVIHGLNLRPVKMEPIITKLTESGIDALNLSLRGHGENFTHQDAVDSDNARLEAFKATSYQVWTNEAYLAFLEVEERAAQKKVPVFFIGYSLGGLIGLDLFATYQDVYYDRMVLFAPAIKLYAIHYLARLLSPFPGLIIPSLAPDSYLTNKKGTPVAAYDALFDGINNFEKSANSKINLPTLIFIDEQDEFIPTSGLKNFIEEKKLDQWQIYSVQKGKDVKFGTFHHHIIDDDSTGKDVWQEIMNAATLHLLNDGASK